jgi:hypothetical protein
MSQAGAIWYDGPNESLPAPSTHTGVASRSRARSAVVTTSAQPPSEVIEQSNRWNGSQTMREARMASAVNGPRP